MNWKKLLSIGALTMFSASIATGQGTAPTIVQGDYISNVFGNSNFIKNPNAKLNNKDVTVSNATVTRSTATPLVATSEFLVTVTSANGTIAWNTRTFDQGMKGQNCEARFTYRGFQSTSVAQVRQGATIAGANVVAQLTLTPSTDPRIASINFPCGDLSQPTYFVITDTATLSGTHEIGGAYVGLATNMANVAQAEFVGRVTFGTDCFWQTTSSTYNSPSDATCTPTVIGNVASVAGVKPQLTITDTRPGNYHVVWSGGSLQRGQIATYSFCSIRLSDGSVSFGAYLDGTNMFQQQFLTAAGTFQYTTAGTRTIGIEMRNNDNTNACQINTSTDSLQFSVYRFPSSSELVVTPERQNVFGAVYYNRSGDAINVRGGSAASNTYSTFNDSLWTSGRDFRGTRCEAPITGDDIGCQIKNMPVGTYKATVSGIMYESNSSTGNTICSYILQETTTSKDVTTAYGSYNNTLGSLRSNNRTMVGTFQNTSVGDRNFILRAAKTYDTTTSNLGECGVFVSNTGTDVGAFNIIIEPLDQPSNSALYVQGPVLGAQTGAAISAGYVGQKITGAGSNVTPADITWTSFANTGALPAGVYQCVAYVTVEPNSGSFTTGRFSISTANNTVGTTLVTLYPPQSANFQSHGIVSSLQITSTGSTTAYANVFFQTPTGATKPSVVGSSSGIECTRLN